MATRFERAIEGDPRAQEELAAAIRRMARYVCRHGGPGGTDVDWEDVAQEASTRLFSGGLRQYRGEGSEDSFLFAVVRVTALQVNRGATRRRQREEVFVSVDRPHPDPPGSHLDVRKTLAKLPPECAQLLDLVFLQGVSYSELAAELGMLESSVRVKVSRCLRKAMEIAAEDSR